MGRTSGRNVEVDVNFVRALILATVGNLDGVAGFNRKLATAVKAADKPTVSITEDTEIALRKWLHEQSKPVRVFIPHSLVRSLTAGLGTTVNLHLLSVNRHIASMLEAYEGEPVPLYAGAFHLSHFLGFIEWLHDHPAQNKKISRLNIASFDKADYSKLVVDPRRYQRFRRNLISIVESGIQEVYLSQFDGLGFHAMGFNGTFILGHYNTQNKSYGFADELELVTEEFEVNKFKNTLETFSKSELLDVSKINKLYPA